MSGYSAQPPMGMAPGMQKTSGKAIAALVLGIVSMCIPYVGIVTGIIAIILGVLGMKEVDRNPQAVKGKGMAIAGVVLGAIALALYVIAIIFFASFFAAFGECIGDPNAPGCEEFQNQSQAEIPALLAMARPTWTGIFAAPGPAWTAAS
ncbi:MAG: DUF4190 domain-containing protein [Thermoplasmatota archaeon]